MSDEFKLDCRKLNERRMPRNLNRAAIRWYQAKRKTCSRLAFAVPDARCSSRKLPMAVGALKRIGFGDDFDNTQSTS